MGDLVGEGDKGGGVLKRREPTNPYDMLYSLLIIQGGEGVEGVGWCASR